MEERKLILGTYDTARDGLWTLTGLVLTDPDPQEIYLEVKGRDGLLDLSTATTDGEPRYGNRTLTATLECSEGTREERQARISLMVNWLDGWRLDVVHPDHPTRYLTGRVKVREEYNDLAHAAVTVTVNCDPWLYSRIEKAYNLTAAATAQTVALVNDGRRSIVPQIVVTGDAPSITLEYGGIVQSLGAGTYRPADLLLKSGTTIVKYSGTGTARITYREAVLR